MPLEDYIKKRDFSSTSEPDSAKKSDSENKNKLIFVIQRHDARRLHYDFRLEMEGVLKSWAVPKGPSMNPSDKRLAIMVEDHPYDYRTFEGTIPKGNYGAGDVIIWDNGYYEPLQQIEGKSDEEVLLEGLEKGSVKIIMYGSKLKGEFALVKMQSAKEQNAWLLLKHKDDFAVNKPYDAEGVKQKLNELIKPMLATNGGEPFDDDNWLFEIKWDGYRAIADLTDDFQLYSRNGNSFNGKYPSVDEGLLLQNHDMIIDGEIVAYNENNLPDFQKLQHYAENSGVYVVYQVFDLLYLNGHSTRDLTLLQRKELLKDALVETPNVMFCDHVENNGVDFYKVIEKSKMEGVMAKKKSSIYTDGRRSEDWVKIKNHQTEEAVIVGFTKPRGSRSFFGSLILGRYKNGELHYAGHVGSGFSDESLKKIFKKLKPLITDKIPFNEKPNTNMPPTWVKPKLIATIKYTQITKEGRFRHPVFIGLREDVDVEIDLKLTNVDKLYWKKEKITKGELIDYYLSVSEYILPHLKGRAQSLHRFPNGVEEKGFYHKDAGKDAPSWVETVSVYSDSSNRDIEYIICNNVETLGYLINLGCIELNPWSNTKENMGKPDYLIIDIDPSKKNSFKEVIEVAKVTKDILDIAKIKGYCKTSGSSGLHIYIPMGAKYSYEQVRDFAHLLMQMVQKKIPDFTTLERSLSKRGPKIYLDYLQNREGQTVASVYSARPRPAATVSMPVEWSELNDNLSIGDFTIKNALSRLEEKGDLFLPVIQKGIDMKKALSLLK